MSFTSSTFPRACGCTISEAELPGRAEDLDRIADAAVRVFLAAYAMP